jgi:hypothetical protein
MIEDIEEVGERRGEGERFKSRSRSKSKLGSSRGQMVSIGVEQDKSKASRYLVVKNIS